MPTFSYKNNSDTDNRLNPADETSKSLSEQESAAFDNIATNYDADADPSAENNNINSASEVLGDAEGQGSNRAAGIENNFTGRKSGSGRTKVNIWRRAGPLGLVSGGLLGIAGLISFFGGPGLLIVHIAETFENKLNQRLGVVDVRMNRIVRAKIENTTTGPCASRPESKRCQFSRHFTENDIKNFEEKGFKPRTTPSGKYFKLESLTFEGKELSAGQFVTERNNNPRLAKAIEATYGKSGGIKFALSWDEVSKSVRTKFKIRLTDQMKGLKSDKERADKLASIVNDEPQSSVTAPQECRDPNNCSDEEKKVNAEREKAAVGLNNETIALNESKSTPLASLREGVASAGGTINSALGVAGAGQSACMTLGIFRGAGTLMKMKISLQMMRAGMMIMTAASAIKAGQISVETASYYGTLITKTVRSQDGKVSESGTDSFGFRSVAYGDKGIPESAAPYIIGASFGKAGSEALRYIIRLIDAGGNTKGALATCKVLNNPFVMVGSIGVGIVMLLVPGVNAAAIGKFAAQSALAVSLFAASAIAVSRVYAAMTGNLVDENTFGGAYMNIASPGFGQYQSEVAGATGLPALTPELASENQSQIAATQRRIGVYDRIDLSPFDASSPNTLLGSAYAAVLPTLTGSDKPSRILSLVGTIPATISKSLSPGAKAAPADDYRSCEDFDTRIIDAATNEFCVLQRGIPQKYLDTNPSIVVERLVQLGFLNEDGEPTSQYDAFVKSCITRDTPLGDSGEDYQGDTGENCVLGNEKNAVTSAHATLANTTTKQESGAVLANTTMATMPQQDKAFLYMSYIDNNANNILENNVSMKTSPTASSQAAPETTGNMVSGSAQELAKQIIANPNYSADAKYAGQIKAVADGSSTCNVDPTILQILATMLQKHKLNISSLNRFCTNTLTASGTGSLHYASGGGHAVDLNYIDGVHSAGGNPTDIQFINNLTAILPQGKKYELGQINCGQQSSLTLPGNIRRVNDSCNHLHFGVYP